MPLLKNSSEVSDLRSTVPAVNASLRAGEMKSPGNAGIFAKCGNAECSSGWLHLWRSRSGPIFEGCWSCSAACTTARIEAAVRRELEGRSANVVQHRHRVPLGLVMLEQGWINSDQLREALDAQKASGHGRLGDWLIHQVGVSEQLVTRALSLQWSCPVLSFDFHGPEVLSPVLPRLFVDAFGALPLRVAAGRILYLGFEDRLDPVVALAIERMGALRVEMGLVASTQFRLAHKRMLNTSFPKTELVEASSELVVARVLTKIVERVKPLESRLVRLHDCLWLRMWRSPRNGPLSEISEVEDVVCSLQTN
jgi:hypothetical protein